jgi:hypothetical protein
MTVRYQRGLGLELAVQTSTLSTDVGLQVKWCRGKTRWSLALTRNGELEQCKLSSQSDSSEVLGPVHLEIFRSKFPSI